MRRWLAFGCLVLLACGETTEPGQPVELEAEPQEVEVEETPPVEAQPVEDEDVPVAPPTLEAPEHVVFPPGPHEHEGLLQAISTTTTRQFKPVGHSSIVFRMRLRSEHTAAFKPRSRQHRRGYRAEVAAYRLSRVLGMDNVPPAAVRNVRMAEIEDRFHPRYYDVETWNEVREWCLPNGGEVPGASIYWIPEMEDPDLDRPAEIRRWRPWLQHDVTIPQAKRELARDLSNMLVFDYLIGNWDRFSGGNIHTTPDESRLFVRDHNAAFATRLPPDVHSRLRERLTYAERFSRGMVERVQLLDHAAIELELARDPSHANTPLLEDEQIAGVLERRETFLSLVGALIERHGEEAVLYFP